MATQEMKSPETRARVDRKTVLIVDDQPETLASLRRLFRDEPYDVVTLGTAADALAWVGAHPVHLILSDERMPDMRGTDLLEKVREKSPDTLRVILTGYPGSSTVQHGLQQGVDWLISKPWNNDALKLTVRQLLEDGPLKRPHPSPDTAPIPVSGPYGLNLFRALVEGVKDYAILMVSPEGRVMSWNVGAERLTGYPAGDILGRPFAVLHALEDIESGKPGRLLKVALEEGRVEDEGWRLRKDGTRFWCNVVMTAVRDPEGNLVGFAKITRDMSERRRADEERGRLNAQMLQGQKLQAIGQLSAGIAHEINNPVGYILSNLNTLGEYCQDLRRLLRAASQAADADAEGRSPAEALKEFRRIAEDTHADHLLADLGDVVSDCKLGGEKIRDIVRSLREFSHVDEGALRPTDLNKCLEDALRICWNELKYKAEVHKDYQRDLPLVPAYPQRLGQVFINLLVNAGQAIEKRGQILLTTRVEDGFAVVRIRDTGRGIAPEHLSKLFEPFFTTKDVGAGTGLGLHVAYKIVTAHRGRIEIKSVLGQGTEFTVCVPIEGPRGSSSGGRHVRDAAGRFSPGEPVSLAHGPHRRRRSADPLGASTGSRSRALRHRHDRSPGPRARMDGAQGRQPRHQRPADARDAGRRVPGGGVAQLAADRPAPPDGPSRPHPLHPPGAARPADRDDQALGRLSAEADHPQPAARARRRDGVRPWAERRA